MPKSSDPSRIAANLDVFDFKLTTEEMTILDSFDLGGDRGRICKFLSVDKNIRQHEQYPFKFLK